MWESVDSEVVSACFVYMDSFWWFLSSIDSCCKPNSRPCFLAQAGDSDDEEPNDLFAGSVGTFDLESDPCSTPKTSQENGHISSENQGVDITTYGESNLVAEPQKVRKRQQGIHGSWKLFKA